MIFIYGALTTWNYTYNIDTIDYMIELYNYVNSKNIK